MSKITAAITGVQGFVPDYVLTNKELETMDLDMILMLLVQDYFILWLPLLNLLKPVSTKK